MAGFVVCLLLTNERFCDIFHYYFVILCRTNDKIAVTAQKEEIVVGNEGRDPFQIGPSTEPKTPLWAWLILIGAMSTVVGVTVWLTHHQNPEHLNTIFNDVRVMISKIF